MKFYINFSEQTNGFVFDISFESLIESLVYNIIFFADFYVGFEFDYYYYEIRGKVDFNSYFSLRFNSMHFVVESTGIERIGILEGWQLIANEL